VATDLDGTLVRSDGTVSDRTRAALALVERAGALLVLVTGRPPRWMAAIVDQTAHRGIAVCANGAVVYDLHTEQVLEEHLLPAAAAAAVVSAVRAAVPGVSFAVERGARGFGHEPAYPARFPPAGVVVAAVEDLVGEPAVKLLVRHATLDADALLALVQDAAGGLATLTHSSREGLVEISATGVSKASALERLAAGHGIGPADVLAFGDMPNDLPMLAWAGQSVAVANAHPDVIAAADEVTASNDEDGVARVLERVYAEDAGR